MSLARIACAGLALLLLAGPAWAQDQDQDGCKDHPLFSRMPNYVITTCDDQEFGVFEFDLGDSTRKVEGHYWSINYEIGENAPKAAGPLQIGRNYWNPMASKGGARLLENLDAGGGTLTARMPGPGGSGVIWLQVSVSNSGEMYELTVVQEGGMRQDVEMTARDLADALAARGSVTLNNILFDTGKATLTAASAAPLALVVQVLRDDAALKLEVQGHTDSVGAKDANLRLSKDRAESVKAYLVRAGIDAARLSTAGFGDSQPVGPNDTEEGRAQNRRVVLVRK